MALAPHYKIHPAIGIARIGNAPADTFFIGPEIPGRPAEPAGTAGPEFKDKAGRIKPQAARFRIWEYSDNGKGKYEPGREISADTRDVEWIEWTVHLANKKAAFFLFRGLQGDPVYGPTSPASRLRNPSVHNRTSLWLDPGARTIQGKNMAGVEFRKGTAPKGIQEYWPNPAPSPAIEYLGQLRTDQQGRLLVIGGRGQSSAIAGAPIDDYVNNDKWFDDVSDGPVTARIKFTGRDTPVETLAAWVICAPPDFAPYSQNLVTLYDLLFDLAARELTLPTNDAQYDGVLKPLKNINQELKIAGKKSLSRFSPAFNEDIWPILKRAINVVYLFEPAQFKHTTLGASGNLPTVWPSLADPLKNPTVRQTIFRWLRPPGLRGDGLSSGQNMPRLLGDDPYADEESPPDAWGKKESMRLTLTKTQYALLEQWVKGNFTRGSDTPPSSPPPGTITPHGLDRAALENCVGGAFYPGIEVGWQIRDPGLYQEPFRLKPDATSRYNTLPYYTLGKGPIGPGHFTRQMAIPWQADFLQCRQEEHPDTSKVMWGWWPAQRPDFVYATLDDAKKQEPMVAWTRSTKGKARIDWAGGDLDDDGHKTIPSYKEMLDNWRSFAFIHETEGVQFEMERPPDVP